MVLKNKNLQKLEKVANRTPHYGIRKLTIGAASVLLGTTLWLGKDAVLAQAADQTNTNEGSNDAKAVTESDKSADTSVDANTKIVVDNSQAADSSAATTEKANSGSVVSQSGNDKAQNITGNVSDSAKTDIQNNQSGSAVKENNAQSQNSVAQNNAVRQKQETPAARANNAIKQQAQSIQSKLSENRSEIAANAQNKLGLNADLTPVQQAQKSIQQAGNQGKVDLDNIDLTKGINAAANKTDANLGAKNVLGNKLALKANASNSSAVLQNNTNDSNNVDSNKNGASLVGGANVSANDGQNVNTNKINKVVVDQNQKDQATSVINKGNAALIAAAQESATQLFDKKASSFAAPAALLASLAEEPNDSGNTDTDNYQTATDWSGVVNALNSNANGVKVSGNITADSNLDIANGQSFTIVGADSNAALNLANHKINNDGNLTLENVTVNGSVMGNGTVNIKGTVSSNVSDANGYNLSTSEKNEHFTNQSQTKGYNIEANKVNVENNASLTINRSSVGDGIHLVADNSAVNVADYGHLTINMNTDNDLNTTARYHDAGIFAESNGNFTTGYKSVVTLNTSIGQGISMTGVRPYTTDDDRFGGYTAAQSRPNGSGQINLGRYSTLNLTGRDGLILGNNSNFNVGDHANVHFENKGRGVALDLANNANINIGTHADTYFHSVGKTTKDALGHTVGPSGSYDGYNYIGVNEGGNITVNEYATFRVILEGRGSNAWDDVVQLDSRGGNTTAAFTSKKGAIIDLRDDNTDFYGELISFPLGASKSKIDIEDPLYVNLQRYSSGGATTGWMPVGGDAINTTSSKYTSNLIYMSGTKGVLHIGGSDYVVYQQIKSDGTKQIWLNVNSVDFKKNGFNSLNPTNNNANPDISINGQGLVGGIKANQIRDDQSDPTHGQNAPAYGISTNRASHQVWIPHETTTEVTGTHKNTIHYVYEDGTQAAPDKTEEINLNRDLTLDITPNTLDDIQNYAQSHNADETLTYIRNSMTVTQDSGWKYTDQNGNAITNPYEVVDSPTIDGYTATVESTNAPGVTVGANGSEVKANFTMPATDAVVQNGKLTDAYKEHGTTGIPADYVTTIVYKKKQNHLAADIQEVNISRTIERDIQYKNNTGSNGQGKYDITDPNNNTTDRTNASQLPDMNPDDLVGDKDTKQTITLNGTAYFDKTTGSFIKVNSDGYAVDAQGRLVTYDDYGNLVVGHLDDTGKLVPTVDANGNTTKTNYVQGGFTWTADYSKANGWNSPTANGYTRTPGTVTKFNASTPTNAKGITDAQGNAIDHPTVQQVLDYLNRESANANNQKAVSEDIIKDASNYPDTKGLVPQDQYIFDQFELTNANGNPLNLRVTLSVDRDNPEGAVHVYFTDDNYRKVADSQVANVNNWNDPVFYNRGLNRNNYVIRVINFSNKNYGNSVSVNVNNWQNYNLERIFGYGATFSGSDNLSSAWGDFKPEEVTQTINYVDVDNPTQEIKGYPRVQVKGLTGQHFDASGVNPLTIAGYTLVNNNAASGSISDYEVGKTYTRSWYDPNTNETITEAHTLVNKDGEMHTVVTSSDGQRKEGDIPANGSMDFEGYTIQNPYVPSTNEVTLQYSKNKLAAQTNPYYVVYTPEDQRKSSVVVNFHDDTTNTEITNFNGQDIGFNSGSLKPGTSVSYTTADNLKTLTDHGYVYVKTVDENGKETTVPTTIPDTPETITVHLVHKIDRIDQQNPHGQKVTATVTRQVNYTVDGLPDSSLPSHTETANFNATGYYDEVTNKVVDLVDGTTIEQGKVKLDDNGNETDGHLTWTVDGGTQDSSTLTGYAVPTKDGYHVNNVTVDPAADKDANADDTGLVKDLTVNHESHNVTVTINLTKNAEEAAHLRIVDDTTGKTLNDNINASGDENTPISFTNGQSTVDGYLQNGYKFVSVVNDATPNSPLSTTSYADGAAKFGNYDTDPKTLQSFTVHLVHKIDRIDTHNPYGQNVEKTVTRKITYTVDGQASSALPEIDQHAHFTATGYWDEVTKKVVDLTDNTTIDEGKVKLDQNGNVADGNLTWTLADGESNFAAVKAPSVDGHHVDSDAIQVTPAGYASANVESTGAVKGYTVTKDSDSVTINIPLVSNGTHLTNQQTVNTKATVHYVIEGNDANKPAAPADNVQQDFVYRYTGDLVDNVTGETITPGHWNVEGSHAYNAVTSPAVDGYTPDQATVTSAQLTVSRTNPTVEVTVTYKKNAEEAAHLRIVDDTTNKTLNDDINANGDENSPISFTNGQSTVDGYLQNGYKFVSVVNDADPNSPLSTNSYADGAAKFGNYDTDPKTLQSFTVHLVHKIDRIDQHNPHNNEVTATVTRQVNYTVDGVPDSTLPSHTEKVVFNATGYYDEVTKKVVDLADNTTIEQGKVKLDQNGNVADGKLTWTYKLNDGATQNGDSTTFTGYAVPTKTGYHVNKVTVDPAVDKDVNADDTGLVKDLSVNTKSHNVTITINLTKNAPAANVADIVNYIDDTTGQTLRTDNGNVISTLTGKPNGNVTYTTADIIKGYESQGYRLVSNDFNDGHEVFGNDGRTYNVHLAHKVTTFTGDNPYGINAKATVTRQVNYTVDGVADNTLPSHTETANFSATGHYDLVEHKVVDMVNGQEKVTNGRVDDGHLTWTVDGGTEDSSTLAGYAVPTKAGYHVNNVTVDPAADKDANADDTGLVKDLSVNHGSHNVIVTINLTKNGQTTRNQRTIDTSATVHYVIDGDDTNKPTAPADSVQNGFQFQYSGDIYDTTTNRLVTPGHWNATSHAYTAITSPAIKGYHTEITVVPSSQLTVTHDNPNVTVTVHYVKDDQETRNAQDLRTSATVHYVVDGNDADKPAAPADNVQNGFTFSYSGDIYDKFTGQLIQQGHWNADSHAYDAVTTPALNGYHAEVTVVPASQLTVNRYNRDVVVTVHYVKNGQTTRNERDINTSATVHYVIDGNDANKPAAPTDNVQNKFQFHYSGDIYDAQTGKLISNGHWNADSHAYDAVTSPVINGYHAVISVVPASQLTVTQANPNVTVTVHYVKNGTTVKNQRSVTASQKVEYQDDQGNTLSPEKDQNFTFNYSGDTYDAVTGDLISRGHWSVASHNFTGENVPVINGYVAVSGYTKNGDNYTAGGFDTIPTASDAERNRTFIVVYKKTGKIIPVDPNHNPIPNVPTPVYPNDPKNPTSVVPNEPVPNVPGYTPVTPTVTPNDPTKDTPVIYNPVAKDQNAVVNYIDLDNNNQQIATSGPLSGKSGAKIDYSTTTTLNDLISKGYVLVNNGFDPNGEVQYYDNDDTTTQTYLVTLKHGYSPVNPDNPHNGVDPSQYEKNVKETVHYEGAGEKTPTDNVQNSKWSRTLTIDNVTGKVVTNGQYDTDWSIEKGQKTVYDQVNTPVVDGYHADHANVPATQVTQNDIYKVVVYSPNGKIVPVGPDHKPIPSAPTPQYPTNPKDPTNVTPNEPVPTVPGYTPTQPTVTPTDPGKDTPVVYVQDQVAQVIYQDVNDPNNVITLGTDTGLTGKAGDAIKDDQVPTKIQNFENQGYVLVNNGFTGAVFDNVAGNTQTFYVTFKHDTVTINPKNPGKPGQPINPNDPNGPKWSDDTDVKHLTKDGTQTIHYTGAGNNTPKDNVQNFTFNHEEVIDKVTGKVVADHGWTPDSHTFTNVDTPVINGYHADRTTAGGATVTPDNPTATIVVTYSPNGKIIPVDPKGNPIPNAPQPQYPTDPKNPTAVTPDEPVPTIPGYTPEHTTVTPTDPGKDTPVIYNPVTPKEVTGKQTVTFVDQNGNQLHDPSVTNHTFTKPGESFTYGNVTVPVIQGYVASKKTAGGKVGTYENPNVTDQIVYTKIGKIVPVDNNGNPIPGASQPIYNNDPKDPTKVVPNEAVPSVPGYNVDKNQNTPGYNKDTNTVTPVDPTKDTKIVYTKQPNEPDNPQGPDQPTQPTTAPSQPTTAPVHPENPVQPTNAPSQPSSVPPHAQPNPTPAPQPSNVPPHAQPSPAPEPAPIKPKAQNNPVVPTVHNVQPKSQTYVPAENPAAPTQTAAPSSEQALPQTGEDDNSIAAALAGGMAVSLSLIGLAGVRKRRRD